MGQAQTLQTNLNQMAGGGGGHTHGDALFLQSIQVGDDTGFEGDIIAVVFLHERQNIICQLFRSAVQLAVFGEEGCGLGKG